CSYFSASTSASPVLQPFPPPTPPPSLTAALTSNSRPFISKEKVRETLLVLVQDNQFLDMVYRALLNDQLKVIPICSC
ncbi:hypothetical protein CISIN_1g046864mg, partial [Citrus sinensis]